ncbi:MAG: hypothetical protein IH623_25180 [Verrucomicrobia bacterium]|nr:hypothetical protein [Verrucomicrobiota bacterium]
MNIKFAATVFLAAILGFSGCSHQKTVVHDIANTDHVVISNVFDGFKISIEGEEARRVVRAVAAAKRENDPGLSTCRELRILFFHGNNFLGSVEACRAIIGINRKSYIDKTGVMETLADRLRQERLNSELHDR